MDPSSVTDQAQHMVPSIAVSLAPVVTGGILAYFKMFIGSQAEFRRRTSLLRATHIEKTAAQHARLLRHAATVADGVLRGDGREEPDFVGEYEEDAFRRVTIFHRLERIRFIVKLGFDALFLTILLGVIAVLCATLSAGTRSAATILGASLVGVQLVVVAVVYYCDKAIDSLEDTT